MAETEAEPQTAETTTEGGTNAVANRPKAQLMAQEGGVLPILPRNIEEAQRYASGMIQANIVPDAFRFTEKEARDLGDPTLKGQPNSALILMGVLKSMEIGVPPQTGLAGLLPLNGRFTIWGDLAVAKVQQMGLVTNQTHVEIGPSFDKATTPLGEWPDDYGVEVRYWRKGQTYPYVGRFTVRDAKRANLWMNSYKKPWIMYPERMLFNRARAFALRDGFADGLNGLAIAEEVMDMAPAVEVEAKHSRNLDALAAPEEETGEGNGQKAQRD